MSGLYFLMPTFVTIFVSFLVVRAGALALMITGLERKKAVFQALSAFTGTGFTTREAERVVSHPIRRRIVSILMILGNAGIVTVIITATSSLVTVKGYELPIHFVIFVVGIFVIYRIGKSKGLISRWEKFVKKRLVRLPMFEEDHIEDLLHLLEGYGLVRRKITKESSDAGKAMSECTFCRDDIMILGIERGNSWIPNPGRTERMQEGDNLVVYGDLKNLRAIFQNG